MTSIEFTPGSYELSVHGHTEYDEEGKDIVCAAISILTYTLAESLESSRFLAKELYKEIDKGDVKIKATPKKGREHQVSLIFWTVLNGLQLLVDAYPNHVKLEIK